MAKMTFKEVDALKPTENIYKRSVDRGLQIRVAPNGAKTWFVQYYFDGKQREYRLPRLYGRVTDEGHLSLQDARIEAGRIRALAREGIDYHAKLQCDRETELQRLAAEKAAADARRRQEQAENLTVTDLFTKWLTDGVRRKDGNAELRRSFAKDVLPEIGQARVKDLTEHHLRTMLRKMVERGVNRSAVIAFGNLKQMFLWAEKRQPWRKLLAEGNPVQLVDIEKILSPDYDISNERTRVLSDAEIRQLHRLFKNTRSAYERAKNRRAAPRPLEATTQLAIWIMLATMCRVGELSRARWEHVKLDKGEWFIPKEDTKGQKGKQKALMVYLSPYAKRQFRQLHKLTGHSEWCFPATFKEGPVSHKNISKQVGDRQVMFKRDRQGNARGPMKNRSKDENALVLSNGKNGKWTPHDLRRTGATLMQSLGVSLEIIDQCQNHVLAGSKTRRHYLHHDYANEKREAWRLLGRRLESLERADRSNVVPLVRSA